jgi:large subunit ribosomal protein L22
MSSERFSYAKTGLVRAEAKHVRSSARKARLVLADIRGRTVLDARKQLLFSPRAVAKDIELVLRSAVTNAEVNHGLSPDDLVIHEAFANEGVTITEVPPNAALPREAHRFDQSHGSHVRRIYECRYPFCIERLAVRHVHDISGKPRRDDGPWHDGE